MEILSIGGNVLYGIAGVNNLIEVLEEAVRIDVDLRGANLRGVDLRDANLRDADLG